MERKNLFSNQSNSCSWEELPGGVSPALLDSLQDHKCVLPSFSSIPLPPPLLCGDPAVVVGDAQPAAWDRHVGQPHVITVATTIALPYQWQSDGQAAKSSAFNRQHDTSVLEIRGLILFLVAYSSQNKNILEFCFTSSWKMANEVRIQRTAEALRGLSADSLRFNHCSHLSYRPSCCQFCPDKKLVCRIAVMNQIV